MDTFNIYYRRSYLIAAMICYLLVIFHFCLDIKNSTLESAILSNALFLGFLIYSTKSLTMKISIHGDSIIYKNIFINRKYNIKDITSVTIDESMFGDKLYSIYVDSKIIFNLKEPLINYMLLIQKLEMANVEIKAVSKKNKSA